jgi:hypothetical protein
MSGAQSMRKSRCDGYAGLIAALDPNRERTQNHQPWIALFSASYGSLLNGTPTERLAGAPHSMHDDR